MYLYTFMHMYGLYITHIFRNIVCSSGIVAYINLDRYKRDEGKWIHIRIKAVTSKDEIRDPPYVRYVKRDESAKDSNFAVEFLTNLENPFMSPAKANTNRQETFPGGDFIAHGAASLTSIDISGFYLLSVSSL